MTSPIEEGYLQRGHLPRCRQGQEKHSGFYSYLGLVTVGLLPFLGLQKWGEEAAHNTCKGRVPWRKRSCEFPEERQSARGELLGSEEEIEHLDLRLHFPASCWGLLLAEATKNPEGKGAHSVVPINRPQDRPLGVGGQRGAWTMLYTLDFQWVSGENVESYKKKVS